MDARPVEGRAAVSHEQLFHTSSRHGLDGVAGFQTHAASAGLGRGPIVAIERLHARYDAPPDAPYQPDAEQMAAMPVALRYCNVAGVGPVVSQSRYVGREYRGRDGAPDEGRFGNFFCHAVVGSATGAPFDGFRPIDLWGSPDWTTDESAVQVLEPLERLTPGSLDVDAAVRDAARSPELSAVVLDAAIGSLAGGPPLLLVDATWDGPARWIAWITAALPGGLAGELSFSTYERRPENSSGYHVLGTTPACDPGAGTHARVRRIAVQDPVTDAAGLYARVAARVAADGAHALAAFSAALGGTDDDRLGARAVLAAADGAVVTEDDLVPVLRELDDALSRGHVDAALAVLEPLEVFDAEDREAVDQWLALHCAARLASDSDAAREVAAIALRRAAPYLDSASSRLPELPSTAPTAPAVSGLGAWVREVESAAGSEAAGRRILQGTQLRLVGLNTAVDRRVTDVLFADLDAPWADDVLTAFDRTPGLEHLLDQLTVRVIEDGPAPVRQERLRRLARCTSARDAAARHAEREGTFDALLASMWMRVSADPATRGAAARTLAGRAASDEERAAVRGLWAPDGPRSYEEMRDLLAALLDAQCPVTAVEVTVAFRALMSRPLRTAGDPDDLGGYLERLPREQLDRPEFWAWLAATYPRERSGSGLRRWADWVRRAFRGDETEIPDDRWDELVVLVGARFELELEDPDFEQALGGLPDPALEQVCAEIGRRRAGTVTAHSDPIQAVADEFRWWSARADRRLVDLVLPTAFESLSAKQVDRVAEVVAEADRPRWTAWAARHPRTTTRAKLVRALKLGRREGRR